MLPKIKRVDFGRIKIDDEEHTDNDILLFWDGVVKKEKSHVMTLDHFREMAIRGPEVVVFGTGFNDMVKIDSRILHEAKNENIDVMVRKTPEALKKFRELSTKGKRVAALVHITC